MPYTEVEWNRLNTRGMLPHIQQHEKALVKIGQIAYYLRKFLGPRNFEPTPEDCEVLYLNILRKADFFNGILKRNLHLSSLYYDSIRIATAACVLHNKWNEIKSMKQ
jgi:hypothetical protein